VTGTPATTLAKIANAHSAVRFAICTSGYATQHNTTIREYRRRLGSQWAAIPERIGRNSGSLFSRYFGEQ
jgi:hypothetical protein